jgi:hypothetical protein
MPQITNLDSDTISVTNVGGTVTGGGGETIGVTSVGGSIPIETINTTVGGTPTEDNILTVSSINANGAILDEGSVTISVSGGSIPVESDDLSINGGAGGNSNEAPDAFDFLLLPGIIIDTDDIVATPEGPTIPLTVPRAGESLAEPMLPAPGDELDWSLL